MVAPIQFISHQLVVLVPRTVGCGVRGCLYVVRNGKLKVAELYDTVPLCRLQ